MAFTFNTARAPLVEIDYPAVWGDEEFVAHYRTYCTIAEAHPALAWILDLRKFDPLRVPATRRKWAAEVWKEHAPRLVPTTVCEARIVTNELTRGILTAFDWWTGAKWPVAHFTSRTDAETWVRQKLREAHEH